MYYFLIDTCVWLDMAKDQEQYKLLQLIDELIDHQQIALIFPEVVVSELALNKDRVIQSNSKGLASIIKRAKEMVDMLGPADSKEMVLTHLNDVHYQIPGLQYSAIGSISLIESLIVKSKVVPASDEVKLKASERAIKKLAPFHHNKNSFADAVIIETFVELLPKQIKPNDHYVFVTHNTNDFSSLGANQKLSHPDFADIFSNANVYYSINLTDSINMVNQDLISEILSELEDWEERPRELHEVQEAENEFFDKVWYHRSKMRDLKVHQSPVSEQSPMSKQDQIAAQIQQGMLAARKRIEKKYGKKTLWPLDDFELGMINGKLSALRWLLGDEWDFLDT